jgi:hypothetical protein
VNFFKKKSKLFISIDSADMKTSPEDLIGLFRELNSELSEEEQLVLKFNELQDVSFSFLSVIISFILLVEKTHSISILVQAGPELVKRIKEANLSPLVSKLSVT